MKDIIKNLTQVHGVSGNEKKIVEVAQKYLEKYGETEIDSLGNLVCTISPYNEGQDNILLDAHIDEIGFIVNGITDEGFLRVSAVGTIDERMSSASEVFVLGKNENYFGIITSKPPHLTKKEDYKKLIPTSELSIDIGMDKKTAQERISLGDRVVIKGDYKETVGGRIISKALDNRYGCAALISVCELLSKEKLNVGLKVMLSVQEEVGLRGAKTGGYKANSTHAIVVDGTFGDKEFFEKESFELGKGPVIAIGPILNQEMTDQIIKIAKNNKIPFSLEVTTRKTGTNADSISLLRGGIKTAMISLPVKNLHSKIEMAEIKDLELASELISLYVKERSKNG